MGLSNDEERKLQEICQSLGVEVPAGEGSRRVEGYFVRIAEGLVNVLKSSTEKISSEPSQTEDDFLK